MARPTLADVIADRRNLRRGLLFRRLSTASMTRAQRLALAPKEPRGPQLQFIRLQNRLLAEVTELVEERLVVPLEEVLPTVELTPLEPAPDTWVTVEGEIIQSEPVSTSKAPGFLTAPGELPDARVGVPDQPALPDVVPVRPEIRLDVCSTCGEGAPLWYAHAFRGEYLARRLDTRVVGGRMGEILAFLEVAISELVGERRLGPLLAPVARAVYAHNRREMERVLQIDLRNQNLGLQGFIQEFIQRNVRLIQSVMFDQLARMEEVVAEGTAGQVRVEVLREQIRSTFGVSKSRAQLIAKDQTLKANADLTQLRQQQAGVTEYIWTTSRDERVRGRPGGKWAKADSNHWRLEGTRQSWLVPPITNPKTGARNHPGRDFQCRCTATPIVDQLLAGV